MYVELKNINKTYGSYQASRNVNFGIEKGKLIGLLGPSGSGKTTILRMIAGLETPDSGEIIIDGKVVNDVSASERGIGFVFQNYALFRYMTVYDNVAFGLKVQKVDKKKIHARVMELIRLVGLEGLEKRYPSQLSGGQRQRLSIARALLHDTPVYIFDEATSNIDVESENDIMELIMELAKAKTIILISHRLANVKNADCIYVLKKGDIAESGIHEQLLARNGEFARLWNAQQSLENFGKEADA